MTIKNNFTRMILCIIVLVATLLMMLNCDRVVLDIDNRKAHIADQKIKVRNINQYPNLPTGCESVAATMVLNYYGDRVSSEEFASCWLECSPICVDNGTQYCTDPNVAFVGDPFSEYSYGCYPPVIEKAININSPYCHVEIITGMTLEELCYNYIDYNQPMLVWVTMRMSEPCEGESWYLPDGSYYTWTSGEHCMVLVGYNDDYYFFNDPLVGRTVAYEKWLCEQRFEEMGSQALFVTEC